MLLNGMSVAAACEKPIMPMVVGSRSSSHLAVPRGRDVVRARPAQVWREAADTARQPRGGFAHAEEFETKGSAPVVENRLFEPTVFRRGAA